MKFNFEQRKKKEEKIKQMEKLIQLKEQELKKKIKKKKKKTELEIKILQKELETITMEEINKNIKFMKQRYFEQANRPGKLMAWQIKEKSL